MQSNKTGFLNITENIDFVFNNAFDEKSCERALMLNKDDFSKNSYNSSNIKDNDKGKIKLK